MRKYRFIQIQTNPGFWFPKRPLEHLGRLTSLITDNRSGENPSPIALPASPGKSLPPRPVIVLALFKQPSLDLSVLGCDDLPDR